MAPKCVPCWLGCTARDPRSCLGCRARSGWEGAVCLRWGWVLCGALCSLSAGAWMPWSVRGWGEEAADLAAWLVWTLATLRRLGR